MLTLTNAGHPPLMVLRDGRAVEPLPYADGPPLGVAPGGGEELLVPFGPGDTLLAYTDGLVERRDEDIHDGLARLEAALPALVGDPLRAGLERVVRAVRDYTYDDDTAVLALRRIRAGTMV